MKNRSPHRKPNENSDSKDEVKAENEVLKLKLELEYGMTQTETTELDSGLENQWLNSIYDFEKHFQEAKRIKLKDYLGQPPFKKIQDLKPNELEPELRKVLSRMQEKGVELDCCTTYEASVLYKFVTEELVEQEIDDLSLPGFVYHFIYEEFHPNHDYDLRRQANEFIEILLRRKLDEFDSHRFADHVEFRQASYSNTGILNIIRVFQKAHRSFRVDRFKIREVTIDLGKGVANITAAIKYAAHGNVDRMHQGDVNLKFIYQFGYWYIQGFQLPGIGD